MKKKWIAIICAVSLLCSAAAPLSMTVSAEPPLYQMGDADLNGVVDMMDVRLCFEAVAGQAVLTWEQEALCMVTRSGQLTAEDARRMFQFMAGQIFPLVKPILYDHAYLKKMTGGFSDTIESIAMDEDWTVEEFAAVCEKSADQMTAEELATMNRIRDLQLTPSSDRMMQKVITTYTMGKYLSGEYKTPSGFLSICADVKQYATTEDFYYGLRLDYSGTYFKPDETMAVIRFFAANVDKATVPRSPANGGTVTDPYPFGGAGFTTGTNGRLGSPEWTLAEFTVLNDGAQILEVAVDGTETLKAVYSTEYGRFLPAA